MGGVRSAYIELLLSDCPPDPSQLMPESGRDLKRSPFLGQPELENSGVRAHSGGDAGEPFMSAIGGLLPIALCGRTSL